MTASTCSTSSAPCASSVATLHTVLREPTQHQRSVLTELVSLAESTVVMSRSAATLLISAYDVDPDRLQVIPHGVPNVPLVDSASIKPSLGIKDREVILSFGLLGQGKGYELAIEALPAIAAAHPDVLYIILGATHPDLISAQGEAYRESLKAAIRHLGMERHVRFVDRSVGREELTRWIEAADVFVTPIRTSARSCPGRCPTRWALAGDRLDALHLRLGAPG